MFRFSPKFAATWCFPKPLFGIIFTAHFCALHLKFNIQFSTGLAKLLKFHFVPFHDAEHIWPILPILLRDGPYHVWWQLHNMLQQCTVCINDDRWTFSSETCNSLLKIKAGQVCSGIGHWLSIIDSFPSLLGALHIGPILVVALLAKEEDTGQLVSVSSLHLSKSRETQRRFNDLGSLFQRSDIKDLADWPGWPCIPCLSQGE